MATIELQGLDSVRSMLAALQGELKGASDAAQNKMAYNLMVAEREELKSSIDRPTPYSVSSIAYKKVGADSFSVGGVKVFTPTTPGAGVFTVDRFHQEPATQTDYLGVQIVGGATAGPRRSEKVMQAKGWMKRGQVWVPDRLAPKDAYGNVRGSMISDMLSNLGANQYGASTNSTTNYVLIGAPGNYEGVWRRQGSRWLPFIWFKDRVTTYRQRWDFYGRAEREVSAQFPGILDYYVSKAIKNSAR